MGKIVVELEIVMDKVRARAIQTLDVTEGEITLALVQLGNLRKDLLKEREAKRRMEAITEW